MVRTRFAPSPTGFLHIGGARTALFSWAYARKHHGKFILRIEDTDLERSTPEAVQAIMDGMHWLNLDYDEGPYYQTRRMDRYKEVIQQLLAEGKAYHCYCTPEELDALREAQRQRGDKPRYDGRWRDSKETPPAGVKPVVRFKNPLDGEVVWDDLVKGRISIANKEMDDLIIARADGVPTYNFCVVVDDWDMNITHVIRGDDHVNNTPRQINILAALGAPMPQYAHLSMILGDDGQKLSKRHGAVSVMQYPEEGYLQEAVVNYLGRLGWSHGDEEIFSMQQFCEWFDLDHITPSAAQFNTEKLRWLNQQYIKTADNERLAALTMPFLHNLGLSISEIPKLADVISLLKDRGHTLVELAKAAVYFYQRVAPPEELKAQHLTPEVMPALSALHDSFAQIDWTRDAISASIKEIIATHNLKMPKVAMPLRVMVAGSTQTPSIDAVLELLGRDEVRARMAACL
ncbi:MAG: glutamate--tRNA ligase [Pseudomonadota bacterium]